MSSHAIRRAWPADTFSLTSSAKWASAGAVRADLCGPRAIAFSIWSTVHGAPVIVGQPKADHSPRSGPAGCVAASPDGCICMFSSVGRVGRSSGRNTVPLLVVHVVTSSCASWAVWRRALFCFRRVCLSRPVTIDCASYRTGGESPSVCPFVGRPVGWSTVVCEHGVAQPVGSVVHSWVPSLVVAG